MLQTSLSPRCLQILLRRTQANVWQAACSPHKRVGGQNSCDRFFATLHTFSPQRPESDADVDKVPWLRIAVAHAMAIMFNLVANGHKLRDSRNAEHVEWLSVAVRSLDESILKDLPILNLWLQVSPI